jgi:hypothetical protein
MQEQHESKVSSVLSRPISLCQTQDSAGSGSVWIDHADGVGAGLALPEGGRRKQHPDTAKLYHYYAAGSIWGRGSLPMLNFAKSCPLSQSFVTIKKNTQVVVRLWYQEKSFEHCFFCV